MYVPSNFCLMGNRGYMKTEDDDHDELTERLRKSLYYGKLPGTERPSMPLTEMAVEFFQDAAPKQLGKLDTYLAASTARSACMSASSVAVGMMYVQRLRRRQPDYLTQLSSSELFLISMMMASKFMYDEGVDEEVFNDEWAESGDMDVEDVNQLEREFLSAIDWQLFVKPDEFADMMQLIEKRIALKQGLERGWFSYTDLFLLSQDLKWMNWNDLTAELSKVMSVSSMAYLASILTMVGSTILATSASTMLVTFGTSVLPLYCKIPAVMFLQPVFSPEVIGSRSLMDVDGETSSMEVMNRSRAEAIQDLQPFANLFREEKSSKSERNSIVGSTKVMGDVEHVNDLESMTYDLGDEEETEMRHKDHGSLFNGFLPPFLALVALKDTFLKFAFAVGGKETDPNSQQTGHNLDNEPRMTEICSHGPCLVDSWANCWNVSSEHDWTEFKSFDSRSCCEEQRQCCDQCRMNARLNGENDDNRQANDNWRKWDRGDNWDTIHCCCSVKADPGLSNYGSLLYLIPDLSLRFTTASSYPAFITT